MSTAIRGSHRDIALALALACACAGLTGCDAGRDAVPLVYHREPANIYSGPLPVTWARIEPNGTTVSSVDLHWGFRARDSDVPAYEYTVADSVTRFYWEYPFEDYPDTIGMPKRDDFIVRFQFPQPPVIGGNVVDYRIVVNYRQASGDEHVLETLAESLKVSGDATRPAAPPPREREDEGEDEREVARTQRVAAATGNTGASLEQ